MTKQSTELKGDDGVAPSAELSAEPLPTGPQLGSGLAGAEDYLATLDENVALLWEVSGPRKSRIASIGAFHLTLPGASPTVVLCQVQKSGKWQFYASVNIARPA